MAEELLEKIPAEMCWAITTETLFRFMILRGDKIIAPLLGRVKDFISPLWSKEKWYEINEKIFAEGGKKMMPVVKEMFNIPIDDAIGAAKLAIVCGTFQHGPEQTAEIIEATPERVVVRWPKCPLWERYEKYEVEPEFRPCDVSHELYLVEGFKEINPKLTCKITKARPRGDSYCEDVYEFKEE